MAWDSSLLKTAVYDARTSVLKLTFQSGAVYRYCEVPPQIYQQLERVDSKGRYFNSHIRDRFRFTKLRGTSRPTRHY